MDKKGHFGFSKYTFIGNIKRIVVMIISIVVGFIGGIAIAGMISEEPSQTIIIITSGIIIIILILILEKLFGVEKNRKPIQPFPTQY